MRQCSDLQRKDRPLIEPPQLLIGNNTKLPFDSLDWTTNPRMEQSYFESTDPMRTVYNIVKNVDTSLYDALIHTNPYLKVEFSRYLRINTKDIGLAIVDDKLDIGDDRTAKFTRTINRSQKRFG